MVLPDPRNNRAWRYVRNIPLPSNWYAYHVAYKAAQHIYRKHTRPKWQLTSQSVFMPGFRGASTTPPVNTVTPEGMSAKRVLGYSGFGGTAKRLKFTEVIQTNRDLGVRPGWNSGKKHQLIKHDNDAENDNQLLQWPLIYISHDADLTLRNKRAFNLVHITGVKIRKMIWLQNLGDLVPHVLRWAIIAPKFELKGNQSIANTNFFEREAPSDPTGDDGLDFSPTLPGISMMHKRINRRLYHVLKEGRKLMVRNIGGTLNQVGGGNRQIDMYAYINEYIPLNRQMEFATDADVYPENHNIWFVYWIFPMNQKSDATRVPATKIQMQHDIFTYFRHPRNYLT